MVEKFEKFSVLDATLDLEKVDFNYVKGSVNPIIFDTNFLFTTFEFKIDVIEEIRRLFGTKYNLFIYGGTIDELASVESKKGKNKNFIPLIIKMLHIYNFKIINSEKSYIDNQILSNLNKKVIIATNDKALRIRIQDGKFRVLYLRQKSYLELK